MTLNVSAETNLNKDLRIYFY